MTFSEVATPTGLTRATTRGSLLTLQALGFVRSDACNCQLTQQVLDIGYAYLGSLGISEVAQPYMEELSQQIHESTSASILDGTDIVYVIRVPTQRIMTISLGIGTRLGLHQAVEGGRLLEPEHREGVAVECATLQGALDRRRG